MPLIPPRVIRSARWLLRTSTFRFVLTYMALFGGSVLLLLTFLYWATAGYLMVQTDITIEAEVRGLAEQYATLGLPGLIRTIQKRVIDNDPVSGLYLLTTANSQYLAGNLDDWPSEITQTEGGWVDFEMPGKPERKLKSYRARARLFILQGRLYLLVGRDIKELEITKNLILRALTWGLAVTLWLALFGGITFSASLARRLENINRTSRRIMRGELGRRMPVLGTGDDFDQLADNLNAMLDQIEYLMAGIRHVTDNIAHDLKTPLTRLRNRLEQLLAEMPDSVTCRTEIADAIAEADQLLMTFNALLRITRIESGGESQQTTPVDLLAVAQDAHELYEALAEDKAQHLGLSIPPHTALRVAGDRDLLFQAVANLLDNAIKYTPAAGVIELAVIHTPESVILRVTDNGPGIPASQRDQVLQRFYRLESSRSTPGNGLGLSLVAAVAKYHQARLVLAEAPSGTGLQVSLHFPRVKELLAAE